MCPAAKSELGAKVRLPQLRLADAFSVIIICVNARLTMQATPISAFTVNRSHELLSSISRPLFANKAKTYPTVRIGTLPVLISNE